MTSLDRSLAELTVKGTIDPQEALSKANDPKGYRRILESMTGVTGAAP